MREGLGGNLLFFFEDNVVDPDRRELRCKGALVPVEPQVFDLIVFLIRNRDRVVSKDDLIAGVWDGRIVSDSTLASRINAARRAIGDSGEQQRLIRTAARKGIRFVGVLREGQVPSELPAPVPAAVPNQEVTFCRTAEGINLALASVGGGAPLIKVANWLTHIEYDWESPIWSPLLQHLAQHCRLIRYDGRGNGLADREVADISFSAFVRDLATVVDAAGLERSALLGISQGAAVAIAYAVQHPERPPRQRGSVRTGPPDRPLDSPRQIRDARKRQSRGACRRAGLAQADRRDRDLPGGVRLSRKQAPRSPTACARRPKPSLRTLARPSRYAVATRSASFLRA